MASTLAEVTDLLTAQQREINDIEVVIAGHGQTLDQHSTDITDLQNPPSAVPPGLLDWLSTHSIREVDSTLDTDLNSLSTSTDGNTEDITNLSSLLDAESAARIEIDTNLNDTDIDLQSQITANLDTLNQEITDRSTLSGSVSDSLDTVNTRIDDLQSDLSTASTTASTASVSMSSQIASLSASLQTANSQILLLQGTGVDPLGALASQLTTLTTIANDAADDVAQETVDRKAADVTLQSSITAISTSVSGLNTSIADEKDERESADLDIQSDVAALGAEVGGIPGLITSETAARTAADAALTTSVSANTDDIGIVSTNLSDEATVRQDADTALQASVDSNSSSVTTHTAQIATNTAAIAQVKAKYGVIQDVGGYTTSWQINDESTPAGNFLLRDLNNDVRLENPAYQGKYFPVVAISSFSSGDIYDADYGGVTTNLFHGRDGNDYTRNVKIYAVHFTGFNGSVFLGADNAVNGNLHRVGNSLPVFSIDFSGGVNRYLSVWYRIKNAPSDTSQRWFGVAMADSLIAGARTYERAGGRAVFQPNVPVDQVIEFGLTVLNTFDATIADPDNAIIYGGSVGVSAINMTTVS